MEKAGLNLVHQRDVPDKELFKNIEEIWLNIGRQPVFRDMQPPLSKYSTHHYVAKFGTWRKALERFIESINSDFYQEQEVSDVDEHIFENALEAEVTFKHKTKRIPSERLKVQVLMRDGNICKLCGITVAGGGIHFDHIFPWSKGGETTLENLQVLCGPHNLAKGNLEYDP